MRNYNTDWEGSGLVEGQEGPDTMVLVWEITPSMRQDGHCCLWIRSWQLMLDTIQDRLDCWLEGLEPSEILEGVSLKIRLIEMPLKDYEEVTENPQ